MKKIIIIVLFLVLIPVTVHYTRDIPLNKDISYSNIDFYNGNPNTSWRELLANPIVQSKPIIIFNNTDNYRPGAFQDEILPSKDGKYNIKFVGAYVEILDSDNNFLFKFDRSSNKNWPVIYSKDNYLIVIANNLYPKSVSDIIVYKIDNKQVYNLILDLDEYKKRPDDLLSFGEFGATRTRELDVADDVLYMIITSDDDPFILSYDINTQVKQKFSTLQNSKCNTIDFVVKDDALYWQESYHQSGLFSKTFFCKSYKKEIK